MTIRGLFFGGLIFTCAIAVADDKAPDEASEAGLSLSVGVDASGESGQALAFSAVFRNTAHAPVSFFVPEHVPLVRFPRFIFTDTGGQRWTPYTSPFQSMWTIGLHGEVVTLQPGEERSFAYEADRFVHVQDPNSQKWNSPRPLPAGTYAVSATYEQADNLLVYGVDRGPAESFASERRAWAGLWTGTLRAPAQTLEIRPPRTTTLSIDSPYELVPGRPFPLTLELRNGSEQPFVFDGRVRVMGSSKAHGTGTLTLRAPGTQDDKLTIAPGQVLSWTVDIGVLDFEPEGRAARKAPGAAPLATILRDRGVFLLHAVVGQAERPPHVASNELWRMRVDP